MLQAECNNTIIEKRRKDTQVLIQLIKPFVFDPLENIHTRKVQQNIVGTFPLKNFVFGIIKRGKLVFYMV